MAEVWRRPTAGAGEGVGLSRQRGVDRESGAARTRDTHHANCMSKMHEEEDTLSSLLGSGTAPHGRLAVWRM